MFVSYPSHAVNSQRDSVMGRSTYESECESESESENGRVDI